MPESGSVALENRNLRVMWDSPSAALQLIDLHSGMAIVDASASPRDPSTGLWRLDLDGDTVWPADAACINATLHDQAITLCWSGFAGVGVSSLTVKAIITLSADGFVCWRLGLKGVPEDWPLDAVRFPRLAGLARLGDEEWLAIPSGIGRLVREPRQWLARLAEGRWQGAYPGTLSMQCMALYASTGQGLYVATDDGDAHLKAMAWQVTNDSQRLDYELLNHPPLPLRGGVYEIPYRAVIGTFRGDWLTAAEVYRSWALQQEWSLNSRFKQGLSAPWLQETGLWMWNRGASTNVISPATALRDYLGAPVSVLWHWWHGCAYDTGFPEYLPPREGTETFRAAVAHLKTEGVHPLPYVNGRLWGTTTPSWTAERARLAAVERRSGDLYAEVYNSFTRLPCAAMCPSTELWQAKLTGLLREIVRGYGLPGVYLDQVASAPPRRCYNPHHSHDVSGGNTWARGYHQLMARVREQVNTETMIATEGCCEVYLDTYDAFLTLESSVERYSANSAGDPDTHPIPFFPSVYHDHAILFGSYGSLLNPPYDELWPLACRPSDTLRLIDDKFSTQFRLELTRQIVWGLQPMLANFYPQQLGIRSQELAFLRRLVRLRIAALKYLRDGSMLRPPTAKDMPTIDIPLRTRSIYVSDDRDTAHVKTLPAVWMSAWRAPDGDVALALVNISNSVVQLRLAADWEDWGLTGKEQRWQLGQDGHRYRAAPTEEEWVMQMAPQGAQVIEWTQRE